MKKVLILTNPSSGSKDSIEFAKRIKNSLKVKQLPSYIYETSKNEDFKPLIVECINEGYDTVMVLGGDGTISKFVNQIISLPAKPKIILLPLGTTNNFARALNTELNHDKLIERIEQQLFTEKLIDIGQLNDNYFISTVSVGSIPETAWKADEDVKDVLGPFGYILEGLKAIKNQEGFDVTITLDGETKEFEDIILVVVGLSNTVFGIPTFFEDATLNDGKLHLFLIKKDTVITEISALTKQIFKRDNSDNKSESQFISLSFNDATFSSQSSLHFAVDGEKGPEFPVHLRILPKYLTFLVPEKD